MRRTRVPLRYPLLSGHIFVRSVARFEEKTHHLICCVRPALVCVRSASVAAEPGMPGAFDKPVF